MMIKPDAYWALHKKCDPYTLGRVAATLGGQEITPPLNKAEEALVRVVEQAGEWYENAIEDRKRRDRERKRIIRERAIERAKMEKEKRDSADSAISADSAPSIHPSSPSVHPQSSDDDISNNNISKDADRKAEEPPKKPVKKPKPERNIIPPTLDMVRSYCVLRGNKVDPVRFFTYWETRGWETKPRQKMVDWQAAVRTFELNGFDGHGKQPVLPAVKHPEGWRKPEKEQHDGLEGV